MAGDVEAVRERLACELIAEVAETVAREDRLINAGRRARLRLARVFQSRGWHSAYDWLGTEVSCG